jgi:hypothetical protein
VAVATRRPIVSMPGLGITGIFENAGPAAPPTPGKGFAACCTDGPMRSMERARRPRQIGVAN